ncbi:MAG: hypothetical protein JWM96_382 [Alphaproteobacteria bacterium]|nr:hypothetical protein [Alphaproteobacteria bacterium]
MAGPGMEGGFAPVTSPVLFSKNFLSSRGRSMRRPKAGDACCLFVNADLNRDFR